MSKLKDDAKESEFIFLQSEGVKIFILLYKEFELALGLNSFYSKRALVSKGGRDKNIKVNTLQHTIGEALKKGCISCTGWSIG